MVILTKIYQHTHSYTHIDASQCRDEVGRRMKKKIIIIKRNNIRIHLKNNRNTYAYMRRRHTQHGSKTLCYQTIHTASEAVPKNEKRIVFLRSFCSLLFLFPLPALPYLFLWLSFYLLGSLSLFSSSFSSLLCIYVVLFSWRCMLSRIPQTFHASKTLCSNFFYLRIVVFSTSLYVV